MFDSCPDMLRVEDVCKLLLISRNSLYILLKSGELKGFQSGRMWRIPLAGSGGICEAKKRCRPFG